MKYLTPEIEALSKHQPSKSLARPNISCGIFQDLEYSEDRSQWYQQQKLEKNS